MSQNSIDRNEGQLLQSNSIHLSIYDSINQPEWAWHTPSLGNSSCSGYIDYNRNKTGKGRARGCQNIMGLSSGALIPDSLNLTYNFSKQAGKGRAAGRKKFLEFSIETDLGEKQKLKV